MRVKDDQKEALLFAGTLALVSRVGLSGLTVPLIAKQSGVATGTVYVYFKSKDDLIRALFKDVKHRFASNLFAGHQPGKPVKESLRALWENGLRYMATHYEEQIFREQFNASPYRREEENVDYGLRLMGPLLDVLHTGQEQGLIKADREDLLLCVFFGLLLRLAEGARENPALLHKAMLGKTFQYFWDAIKA